MLVLVMCWKVVIDSRRSSYKARYIMGMERALGKLMGMQMQ
jgi:hypothetical protein